MALIKCKMCGGTLEFNETSKVGICEYCGTKQTLPTVNDEKIANLYDRANHFRRNNDYDKALEIYEKILNENTEDAEAYWSLVSCKYGIEYVEDPKTHKRMPTVNRAQYTSIYSDEDYKEAIKYANYEQKELYEEEAKQIDTIQKGILEISKKEEPFDVFICYKETDESGRRTKDSVLANDLYCGLKEEGFKVFFARITLEDKLGVAYEPYIFAALNSAKVMVVLGTKPEYFNAVWVKNEWSRYLALIKKDNKRMLIPAYKDMDPYDLPEEFSHLQAQDMSKLGFMQDLIRGIKKILSTNKSKEKETVVIKETTNSNITPLIKRMNIFLEDSEFEEANNYAEKILDLDPECGEAYLGKLLSSLYVTKKEDLKYLKEPFDNNPYYQKVKRYCSEEIVNEIEECIETINNRNHENRLKSIYNQALNLMNQNTEESLKSASNTFLSIEDYSDSKEMSNKCLKQIEKILKEKEEQRLLTRYNYCKELMNKSVNSHDYEETANELIELVELNYKDTKMLQQECIKQKEILIIKEKEEREKQKKLLIKITSIIVAVIIVIIIAVNVNNKIQLNKKLDKLTQEERTIYDGLDSEYQVKYLELTEEERNAYLEFTEEERKYLVGTYASLKELKEKYEKGEDVSSYIGKEYGIVMKLDNEYEVHYLRVANVTKDNSLESKTASGLVIEFSDIITEHKMNTNDTNKGGWEDSEMRTYVNNDIYNAIPSNIRNLIIDTTVVSGHGYSDKSNFTTTDKLYLLAPHEIYSDKLSYDTGYSSTRQLDYYKSKNVLTSNYSDAKKKYNGSDGFYWLRSANSNNNNNFYNVNASGDYNNNNANNTNGVAPDFYYKDRTGKIKMF